MGNPSIYTVLVVSLLTTACASSGSKKTSGKKASSSPISILSSSDSGKTDRLKRIEAKIALINAKLNATRISLANMIHAKKLKTQGITPHPSHVTGAKVEPPPSKYDPYAGFVNNEPVQHFRDGMILFEAGNYSDSILELSSFVNAYKDHSLAGTAQFYIGEAYFNKKQYALALEEYNRVLVSYEKSGHIPETLAKMGAAQAALNRPDQAARHRQLLKTVFPSSPAARGPFNNKPDPEAKKGKRVVAPKRTVPAAGTGVPKTLPPNLKAAKRLPKKGNLKSGDKTQVKLINKNGSNPKLSVPPLPTAPVPKDENKN